MRKYVPFVLLAFVGILFQMTLLSKLPLRPDLAFLVVVYLGLNRSFGRSLPAILVIGYLTDVFSGLPKGTFLLVYLVCFCLAHASTLVFYFRGAVFPVVVASSLSVVYVLILALLWTIGYGRPLSESGLSFGLTFAFILGNSIAAIVLFRVSRWIDARLAHDPALPTGRKTLSNVLPAD